MLLIMVLLVFQFAKAIHSNTNKKTISLFIQIRKYLIADRIIVFILEFQLKKLLINYF